MRGRATSARAETRPAADREVTLYIGDVHASREPVLIKTLLGSCISVCLYDPVARVGGMNHFMLPRGGDDRHEGAARFGVDAMDRLIGAAMKAGGDRRRFVAKAFGGACVLRLRDTGIGVHQKNIEFVRAFLQDEGFPLVSADVGGNDALVVHFYTETGRAFVKRLTGERTTARVARQEQRWAVTRPAYGDVTLFE